MKNNTPQLILSALSLLAVYACKQPDLDVSSNIEVPVSVIEASKSSIEETINTTGTVFAMKDITLSSEIDGAYRLQTNPSTGKPYALGDWVKKGAAIIKLEDAEYLNGLRIESKKVDYEISEQEYKKQKSLYDKGGATLRELKDAEIDLLEAKYDLESNEISLAKMNIKAPFSGVISDLTYYTEGTKIESGTELVKIIDYTQLYLEASLPEQYFPNIKKGFKVYISSYTRPLDTLIGKVTQISPEIDEDTRTFKSFVNIDNTDKILLPGMFAKADLVVNSSEDVIVVPKEIVQSQNRKKYVYVVDKGVADKRTISTRLENAQSIEVLTGLKEGESVVSKGFETLQDNSKVKVLR